MLRWTCLKEKCQNPCCGPFYGVSADSTLKFALHPPEIPLTYEDERRMLESYGAKAKAHIGHRVEEAFIKLRNDGSCPFWEKGLCSVHQAKASACRAYPLYLDMITGINIITSCPGIGNGWTTNDELNAMLRALAEIYEFQVLTGQRWEALRL